MSLQVLLAEDDPDIRFVATLALKKAGLIVSAVSNGEAVLARVQTERPDVVLLDWMMPDMDGFEACRRLKADPVTATIPVIFLTAKSQEGEIAKGMQAGAAGYITKPFDALSLGAQVLSLLARAA